MCVTCVTCVNNIQLGRAIENIKVLVLDAAQSAVTEQLRQNGERNKHKFIGISGQHNKKSNQSFVHRWIVRRVCLHR